MEKHKLFISGLCFDTTEETLRDFFSEHGTIKSIRIVTARSGKSKVSMLNITNTLFHLDCLSWIKAN